MDAQRIKRLTKLVKVQRQIQALHETRHATHLANAMSAERDAHELIQRFDGGTPMSALFPDLYHQRISRAFAIREEEHALANQEVARAVAATLRADKVDRERREAGRALEEKIEQHDRLEFAARKGRSAG
ncbi:MAG: hypothetical protein JJ913_11615 [Rhizobiaceae bacterium]|nr:hypothetical protein [Rhizobiaceae bacterium]